jgi:heat shock protein HslJ
MLLPFLAACGDNSATPGSIPTPTLQSTLSPTTEPPRSTSAIPATATTAGGSNISPIATTASPSKPAFVNISGVEWHLQAYKTETNTLAPPLNDTKITAFFSADGKITGKSGCNFYTGDYQFDQNSNVTIKELASTAMACLQNQIMEQENIYLKDLRSATSFEVVGGNLNLEDQNGNKLLVFSR